MIEPVFYYVIIIIIIIRGMAGTNSQSGFANLLFCKYFAENYMKKKKFGLQGQRASLASTWIPQ